MLRAVFYSAILSICIGLSACKQQERGEQLAICFTGDVLLDRGVRQQIERTGIDYLFDDVKDIFKQSDAVVVNLECPVTKVVSPINKRFIFRGESEWLPALRNAGVTHAVLANNHSMDQGREGLKDTYLHLSANEIVPLGYGYTQRQACEPVFISEGNVEVALFSSVTLPLENWVYLEDEPGVCQASVESIIASAKELKLQKPDCYIVVILHWGLEYQELPTPTQRIQGQALIDNGVDAVIGHHPHVIQKEEIYKGRPIFYSLGNFVFDQQKPPTRQSVIVRLLFDKSGFKFEKYPVDIKACKPTLMPDQDI